MRRIFFALTFVCVFITIASCHTPSPKTEEWESVKRYTDVPGVTEEEEAAIEALKASKRSLSFGHLNAVESFQLPDGTYDGFSIRLVKTLSELFDMEFVQKPYNEWKKMEVDLNSHSLDFSLELSPTVQNMRFYYMSGSIANRSLEVLGRPETLEALQKEEDVEGRTVGFLKESIQSDVVYKFYPSLSLQTVEVEDVADAARKIKSGEMDVLIVEESYEPLFSDYDFIDSKDFFPLAYTSISMATANSNLTPMISVVNKYLAFGGRDRLYQLYREGEYEYAKNKIYQNLTTEEREYIRNLKESGTKVEVGFLHDAYPVSYYDKKEKEFRGIAVDILAEVTKLTDVGFAPTKANQNLSLSEVLAKLKYGEVEMTSHLPYSESRKKDYLWSGVPYLSTRYALLTKADFPDLSMDQVYYEKVGTIRQSVHEEMFRIWFPRHEAHFTYETANEGFDALEKGEIDLLMLTESMLLMQTNYREKPGFKINIRFNASVDSCFGYNKEEKILRSIVDKALLHVKTEHMADKWMNKALDYTEKFAELRKTYVAIFVIIVASLLLVVLALLLKIRRMGGEPAVHGEADAGGECCFSLSIDKDGAAISDAEPSDGESPVRDGSYGEAAQEDSDKEPAKGAQALGMAPRFQGRVLLCEDNEINQHVISDHLKRVGLEVVVAENGKKAVELVSSRLDEGGEPFDLIFMDIYMPEMGGLEASDALVGMGNQAPVVALTANLEKEDVESYKAHGMSDYLVKPFQTQELWDCLGKYFAAGGYERVDEKEQDVVERKQRVRLLTNFVKSNRDTFQQIRGAMEENDVKAAHRMAHTLGSLAALVGKESLKDVARAMERDLSEGKVDSAGRRLEALERELDAAIREFSALLEELDEKPSGEKLLDKARAKQVFDGLELLLQSDNAACLELLDDLREIPETDELIEQVGNYEFEAALEVLARVRKDLEV